MKAEDFKGVEVRDQYGERFKVIEINGNMATVARVMDNLYHTDKIFYKGKSVREWLNKSGVKNQIVNITGVYGDKVNVNIGDKNTTDN
jgi:hypothetical protein